MASKYPPVAIVGVSALFPGSITAGSFWKNIMDGADLLTDIPDSYFLVDDYYDADPRTPDKTYAKRGGFIPDTPFAPMDFGVPPNIIPATDTAQLLALNVAHQVLLDATNGDFANMDRDLVSCILGVASATELVGHMSGRLQQPVWERALRNIGLTDDQVDAFSEEIAASYTPWQESTFPGLLGNVVAGRIANRLDLGGTNVVVDAACGSSLAAVEIALNELYLGQSDLVITGGVDTLNDILMFMCFSKTPALSPSGDCRPFSDAADGTMLGEGIGMVALKRLEDAEKDGDEIYGVIKGLGTSSDGRSKSIYAPVSTGQAKSLRRAYEIADYSPETVEVVEAHGTGTKAGDKAEFGGLEIVFRTETETDANQWCALGTVKSQIGHTKAAAGSAGLVKIVMALHHKVIPPTAKVDQPHQEIDFEKSPFYLSTKARPWIRSSDHPRRASVSAFGFGGTNFHCTVEEYLGNKSKGRARTLPAELFVFAGEKPADVLATLKSLDVTDERFRFVAQNSQQTIAGLKSATCRVALVANDAADLQKKIAQVSAHISANPDVALSMPNGVNYANGATPGKVAFLFPGQGSQYITMGSDLAMYYDVARDAWDKSADTTFDGEAVHQRVFPLPVFDDAARDAQQTALTQTEWAQPAIGTASVATLQMMNALGIKPTAVGGHSYGEITALFAAGVIDQQSMLDISRKRGELMAAASEKDGSMTAVVSTRDELQTQLDAWGTDVVIANHNAPTQIVLSGATAEIEKTEAELEKAGMKFKRLPVATAFHSPIVSDSTKSFAKFLNGVDFAKPVVDVFANTTAAPYAADAKTQRKTLAAQIGEPVRFVAQIEAMYAAGVRTFIEVGPDAVLSNLVGKILGNSAAVANQVQIEQVQKTLAIPTDRKGKGGIDSFFNAVGQMFTNGLDVNFDALWEGYNQEIDPQTIKKPAMTVDLRGSNYDKPSPYREPSERAKQAAIEMNTPQVVHVPTPVAATPATPQPVITQAAPNSDALARLQQETARVQSEYQRMMADSHAKFLNMAESSLRGMIGDGTSTVSRQPIHLAAPVYQAPAVQPHQTAVLEQAQQTVAEYAQETAVLEQAQETAVLEQAQETAVLEQAQETAVGQQAQETAVGQQAQETDLTSLMLDVVSEKTGYPTEMLELSMELEADLGIDSIKRVEILSGMQERVPAMPEVETAKMAALVTLDEVVGYMASLMGDVRTVSTTTIVPSSGSMGNQGTRPLRSSNESIDLTNLMLEVVAEKTGYPSTMLELSMELESDLGIDSIKRVEILSAMQDRVPTLPEVETSKMAALVTLQEIVDYMSSLMGDAAPISNGNGTSASSDVDLTNLMLEVVAEKTGYPSTMLELSMELESDLGIDSIKRVEILSAMQDRVPTLPEVETSKMAALVTLQEIVDYMSSLMGDPAPISNGNGTSTNGTTNGRNGNVDLTNLMLEVVAEKTGYPSTMLELSMELESDLGIDSIKRVEILSAMQDRVPTLPEVETSKMVALVTLQEIVDYMKSLMGDAPSSNGNGTSKNGTTAQQTDLMLEPEIQKVQKVTRYVVQEVEAPQRGLAMYGLGKVKTATVVTPDIELGAAFQTNLEEYGVKTRHAQSAEEVAADAECVIYLTSLDPTASIEEATAMQRDAFETAAKIAAHFEQNGGVFVTVQSTGGDFGRTIDLGEHAFATGLTGLVKTAHKEWPAASVRAIDIAPHASPSDTAAIVLAEMWNGGAEIEVGLKQNSAGPTRVTFAAIETEVAAATQKLTGEDVIVVSGGARGVTAASVVELASQSKASFVLLGRTAIAEENPAFEGKKTDAELKGAALELAKASGQKVTPKENDREVRKVQAVREINNTVADIHALGGKAIYVSCDVRNRSEIDAVLKNVRKEWGPVTGIVHGAGVIADAMLSKKTTDQFDFVFETKVDGMQSLLDVTRDDELKMICAFSSVAARTGNPGQSDYAMANEVLNRISAREQIRRPDAVVKSIGWGPWESGMVTPALAKLFASRGVALVGLKEGAEAFAADVQNLHAAGVEVVIGGGVNAGGINRIATDGVAQSEFSIGEATQPYLNDHTIKGRVVVPMVMAMEWIARESLSTNPATKIEAIRGMRVLNGMTFENFEKPEKLTTRATTEETGQNVELRDAKGITRYSANVEVTTNGGPSELAFEGLNGDVSKFEIGRKQFYTDDTLFHGPMFQCLENVDHMSENGARATLHGVNESDWSKEAWVTDPLLLDGCLQLALLWGLRVLGQQTLPMHIDTVVPYAAPQSGELHCELVARDVSKKRTLTDMRVTDSKGNVVCDLRGVEMYIVPTGTQN